MARSLSLYETATGKGRVIRNGEIVQLVMDGAGAFVCSAQDFMIAQKWAMSRIGSGNAVTDRGRFIDKIEVLISRPNSFVSTRGSSVPIIRLAKSMKQASYVLKDWNLTKDVIDAVEARPDFGKKKLAEAEELPEPAAEPKEQ